MNTNLIDEAKDSLTVDFLNEASQQIGETSAVIQTALNAALPTILSGLIQRVSEPGGVRSVMDLTARVTTPGRAVGNVAEPAGGMRAQLTGNNTAGQFTSLLATGSNAIQSLFGTKAGAVIDAVASFSGLKTSSASSVMSLAGTVMLGVLGRRMATSTSGPLDVAGLLTSQTNAVWQAMPVGLGALLAMIPGFDLSISGLHSSSSAAPTPSVAVPASLPTEGQYSDYADSVNASAPNRWLPWLLLVLGAVALFFILRSCQNGEPLNAEVPGANLTDSMNVASDATVDAVTDSAGSAISEGVADLGAFFKRKLPSGVELNIPENGIENKLVGFIEDTSKPVDKTTWFNFDRLLFDTGRATLQPASQEQLGNIADVLKAYPNVTIKLGGYTDNTGNAQANQKLSTDRADTVMHELIRLGIAPDRLAAEGYGAQYPLASNDTEAGRAQNRRIAVRVTRK